MLSIFSMGVWTVALAKGDGTDVSGQRNGHSDEIYFGVGKINREQDEEYALRKGMSMQDAEYWLSPNLGYDAE